MEVPHHFVITNSVLFFLAKPLVDRVLRLTVNANFIHHLEGHAIVFLAEGGNIFSASGLLSSEVVAWKSEDHEIICIRVLIQFFKAFILAGEAAFRCGIDNEHTLTFQLIEREYISIYRPRFKFVKGFHGFLRGE